MGMKTMGICRKRCQEKALRKEKALDAVAGELGVNLIYRTGSYDAENQTTDIENLIAAGVDGIMCVVIVDTATDELLKVCEEADVDYQVFFRNIMDEEAYNYCMASDHFAGYICEDEAAAGVDMVDELIAQGCTTFGLINREAGNGVKIGRASCRERVCLYV